MFSQVCALWENKLARVWNVYLSTSNGQQFKHIFYNPKSFLFLINSVNPTWVDFSKGWKWFTDEHVSRQIKVVVSLKRYFKQINLKVHAIYLCVEKWCLQKLDGMIYGHKLMNDLMFYSVVSVRMIFL